MEQVVLIKFIDFCSRSNFYSHDSAHIPMYIYRYNTGTFITTFMQFFGAKKGEIT